MGFAVQTESKFAGGKDKNVVCSNCNRLGHKSEGCFKLIGYPEWWGDRPKGAGRGNGVQRGTRGRGRGMRKVNAMQTLGPGAEANVMASAEGKLNGLSNEQWQTLLGLLNSAKPGAPEKLTGKCMIRGWIIDSGASHHMTGQLELLRNLQEIMECSVGLPDGKHTVATKEVTIVLNDALTLNKVLYVPNLKCNLLSVSQLVNESGCVV